MVQQSSHGVHVSVREPQGGGGSRAEKKKKKDVAQKKKLDTLHSILGVIFWAQK